MKKNIKRVLSLALVFCLILGLTVNVYATGDVETDTTAIETTEEATEVVAVENTETIETTSVEKTEETEAETAETEAVAEEVVEEATEDDVENGISLASEDDGIATVSDDTEDLSVTVYTNATATVSWDSTTKLEAGTDYIASGSIYATDDSTKVIATYTVTETENSGYTYSLTTGNAVSNMSSGYYVIGTSGSYLAVDSDGNLTTSSTINASSVWIVTSSGSGYTIQNASTGAYLTYTTSGSGGGTSYSLAVSDDTYTWSWSSTYGFYFTTTQGGGPSGSTTYYRYINTSGSLNNTTSSSVSNKASLYTVTATAGDTTYTYTVTVTGVATGTGTLALTGGISIAVTVKVSKYTESGLNISYGWHVANIETFTSNSNTYVAAVAASTQAMATISGYDNIASGYITAQYNSASQGQSANYVSLGTVYGYDADVYYSGNTDGVYSLDDLNVTVYGSDETGTGTSGATLTMAQSTGEETTKTQTSTDGNGQTITFAISDYEEETIYDYNYITIVPENGYYVSNIVIGCAGSLEAAAGSPYAETSANIAFTNENGNDDLFGAYGVGCTSMSKGSLDTASYDPTTGTVVELDMSDWIESHAEDKGVEDPYFILIEIEKIPTPLYVEYEAGDGDGYISADYIVSTSGDGTYTSYATATSNSVAFSFDTDELEAVDYLYTVLDPAVASYTKDNTTYYFTGWAVTYYTTASTNATETYIDDNGNILDSENGNASYPYLSGTVSLASDAISYGSGTTLYLFTHVKLVAQWTTVEPSSVDYVVDFGLPVNLTLLNDLSSELSKDYTWSVLAVSSHPTYGTATVNSAANGVTYTLTEVMDGYDTMSVWLAGSSNGTVISYAVVYVNIYPATTVYYEEGFATYGTTWSVTSGGSWTTTGSTGSGTQETHVANVEGNTYNNYGYDDAYSTSEVASNGTQASSSAAADSLSFTFTGTGVDIYANCTSKTGTVLIRIKNSAGTTETMLTVDTSDLGDYASSGATSYNTPIASVTDLTYGEHTVTIYVSAAGESINFNFDGFRVYDTISQTDKDIQDSVYYADGEDYPVYTEIRDVVLNALIGSAEEGATITEDYVDSMSIGDAQVYASYDSGVAVYYSNSGYSGSWNDLVGLMDDGAKNELYLPAGVTLVLKLDSGALNEEATNSRAIQIGVKSTSGTGSVTLSAEENATAETVSTVDMFYEASVNTTEDGSYVTITNSGSTTISLTKLKASDEVSISDEAITESEMTALLTSTDDTEVEEETVFEPETFTVSTSVKTSSKSATVTVTAKTSTDVESITVNGTEVTSYKTVTERSGQGRNATTTTYRQFTYTETVTESGTYTYEVAAVSADGVASDATTATATVTIRTTGNKR